MIVEVLTTEEEREIEGGDREIEGRKKKQECATRT